MLLLNQQEARCGWLFVCFCEFHVFLVCMLCLPAGKAPLHVHFVRYPSLPGGPHVYLRWMLPKLRYWMYQSSESRCLLNYSHDISVFILQNLSVNARVWIVRIYNLDVNELQSSQTWMLDVRDLNNRRYSFLKPAQMKIHPHYSWHQTGMGPKAGSFAAECGRQWRQWPV